MPSSLLKKWEKAALNYKLKDLAQVESTMCSASIRIMGDHSFGDKENEAYGVALAIAKPDTVSIPVQRKDLEELYFVIAGKGEVWLKDIESEKEKVVVLKPGTIIQIPSTSVVQYRNTGKKNLILLVPTNPPYGVIGKKTNWKIEKVFEVGKWQWKES